MSPTVHRLYLATLTSIVVATTLFLSVKGYSYYATPMEERFYHPDHDWFKPSGVFGHGLGIVGTLLIVIGVFGYIAKKKYKALHRFGRLKYWLEFHIFLCTLGPVMILFHTAFKFGGIVSVSFWSMVAVVASGVIGRFIYTQIPRSIEGRELTLNEIKEMKGHLDDTLKNRYQLAEPAVHAVMAASVVQQDGGANNLISGVFSRYVSEKRTIRNVKSLLSQYRLAAHDIRYIVQLVRHEISINHRIERLQTMQKLFRYWHIVHLPFALIMLIIMVIHVAVTITFGFRWIF